MSTSKKYLHPNTRKALEAAIQDAGLRPVITQTLGNAPQSAGFHAADGQYKDENGAWVDYCGAIDFSVNQKATRLRDGVSVTMTEERIKWFLYNLATHNIVAWYRYQGAFTSKHIHGVHAGVKLKPQLDRQVSDFLNNRTGLASHGHEEFWTADAILDRQIQKEFQKFNKLP